MYERRLRGYAAIGYSIEQAEGNLHPQSSIAIDASL